MHRQTYLLCVCMLALATTRLLAADVATNKKIYDCTWMATPQLSSPADWVKSPLLNDPRYKEARFQNYDEQAAADLVTDATVQRGTGAGDQTANPRETSFYMVYREDGWYIYIQSNEPDIVNGKPGDSQLEVFFSPGIGDEIPYNQFIVTLSTGGVEDYDWQTFNRHYRPLAGYLQSKTEVVPGGWGTTIFIPWEFLYDRLPLDGDLWRFNVIRWAPSGATTWGGQVHETGRFNLVRWQPPTPDQRMAIQKYVLGKAWQQYQARADALTAWWSTEPATRDLAFYHTAVEPLIQQCDAPGATMANLATLGPDATAKLFQQVPKWMEIQYTVDELRRDYLLKQMFPS